MHDDLKAYLIRLDTTLDQNSALLIRVDERLKAFSEKVNTVETDLKDIKKHVQTVRTVGKIVLIAFTSSGGLALLLWRLLSIA